MNRTKLAEQLYMLKSQLEEILVVYRQQPRPDLELEIKKLLDEIAVLEHNLNLAP